MALPVCTLSHRGHIVSICSSTVVNHSTAAMNRSGSVDESCSHHRSIVRHRIDDGFSFFHLAKIRMTGRIVTV